MLTLMMMLLATDSSHDSCQLWVEWGARGENVARFKFTNRSLNSNCPIVLLPISVLYL